MFRVIKAMGRYLAALGFLLTGQIDDARKTIDQNPNVMNAKYEEMINDLKNKITKFIDASSKNNAFLVTKKLELTQKEGEITKLQQLQNGALSMGKKVAAELQSKGEDPATNPEYIKHRSAYNDFSSTLLEKTQSKTQIMESIKHAEGIKATNLSSLRDLNRELDKLKQEQGEMVSRMITATEQRSLSEMIAGLDNDTSGISAERGKIRKMVLEQEASAALVGEISGTNAKRVEAEYLDVAVRSVADSEFDSLAGIQKAPQLLSQSPQSFDVAKQTDSVTVNRS